ncbi:MAG TPA: subclass B3 metallo-beta-lactamase [Novosphingobium sp.]|nr:subclass B3 metallo-beta-lactamase [Novosphingobium sp.]
MPAGYGKALAAAALFCAAPLGAAQDDLTRPIAQELAPRWLEPEGPVRVHGATWLVGFTHLNVVLIATDAGLILIDTGLPQAAPLVEQSLTRAGFSIRNVRYILSSEPHYDHAGGIAALARDSGATVLASAAGARILRAGESDAQDPQRAGLFAYPPVRRVRVVRDGQVIRLGKVAITAHATPGHTPGSMSWAWTSCAKGRVDCARIVFAASLNSLTDGVYRYVDHPDVVSGFRRSFATVRALPCDILITGHPEHSGGDERLASLRLSPDGYRSDGACRALADRYEAAFDARLREEGKAAR